MSLSKINHDACAVTPRKRPPPELVCQGVWRGDQWLAPDRPSVPSGHALLDRALPGGGWPPCQLIELLQPAGMHTEWRLLLPTLSRSAASGLVLLIAPPHNPNLQALAAQGLGCERLWRVDAGTPSHRLWAAEQALRCTDVSAVVAWFPHAESQALRRLHTAAQAAGPVGHPGRQAGPLLFAWRPAEARASASPATLRLQVNSLGRQGLRVEVFKRRGPVLEQSLVLEAAVPVQRLAYGSSHPATPTWMPAEHHVVDRAVRLAA